MRGMYLSGETASPVSVSFAPMCGRSGAGAPWGYEAHNGPTVWGRLDAAYSACALGAEQSPIDLTGGRRFDRSSRRPLQRGRCERRVGAGLGSPSGRSFTGAPDFG